MRFHSKGRTGRTIRRGDVVVIHDANEKRLMWTSGVVTDLITGKDGKVRAAKVRIPGGKISERAVRCLYPTEVRREEPEEEEEAGGEQPQQPEQSQHPQQLPEEEESFSGPEDVGNYSLPTRTTTRKANYPADDR